LDTLNFVLTIAKVALGLGFVVFIHELGHFFLAKWNGVKVEKFSIGFGPTLFGFRRGETEYVLAALPLGGFVKMLGEGADEQESNSSDPRAYPNKSVSARMAIISAGVIMNVVLAFAFFSYVYTNEREDASAVLGAVSAGSVAYEAGLRAGDEIVAIDDRPESGFTELRKTIALSSHGQVLHFQVKRPGHEGLISLDLQPRRDATADAPTIGILPSDSLEIGVFEAPPGMVNPPTYRALKGKERESNVDVLVEAGPEGEEPARLNSIIDYDRVLARYFDRPITHVIERRPILPSGAQGAASERFVLTIPPNHFLDFGLRLEIGPIDGIRKGSPAEKAGFRKGDRIVKVNGQDDFDPMRLPGKCFASAGKPLTFEVEREGRTGSRQTHILTATPDDTPPRTNLVLRPGEPVDLAGLGFCYSIRPHVLAVRPGSPADKAGLKPGDTINALARPKVMKTDPTAWSRFIAWIRSLFNWDKPEPIEFKDESHSWFEVFVQLQYLPIREVELTVHNASQPKKITPEIDPSWFNPTRGFLFQTMFRKLPAQDLPTAMRSGYDETIKNIVMVYSIFRSLAERRVSPKQLGGPIMIAKVAYFAAGSSFTELIRFLGMLSINLAVLNFLPIPPLDGGQMLFLIAEKVRGRPLPESALIAGTYFGLILVLSLMVFVTYQDVFRSFTG
jgi:regulator of sigma E protease